jgi:hypothetical protein
MHTVIRLGLHKKLTTRVSFVFDSIFHCSFEFNSTFYQLDSRLSSLLFPWLVSIRLVNSSIVIILLYIDYEISKI